MPKEKKNDVIEKKINAVGEFAGTLMALSIIVLIAIPTIVSPLAIPYLHYKTKQWRLVENKCWLYVDNGLYERAIEYINSIDDKGRIPSTYACIGTAYYKIGNLELALQSFKKAEELENSILYRLISDDKSKDGLKDIYIRIAKTLHDMKKYDKAVEYYKKALDLIGDSDDRKNEYRDILIKIAKVYEEKGDVDIAIRYYQDALIYYCNECHKEKEPIYRKLAELYEKKGDKSKAERYLNMASELSQESPESEQNGQLH